MKIRFFKPFDELSGKEEMEIPLTAPVRIRELLGVVEKKLPSFKPYVRKEGDEILNFFVILARGDEILKLDDFVREEDQIKILPPISGG